MDEWEHLQQTASDRWAPTTHSTFLPRVFKMLSLAPPEMAQWTKALTPAPSLMT